MTPGCDGCELRARELVDVLQVLCGARERDRWDWVDQAIDKLGEMTGRKAGKNVR